MAHLNPIFSSAINSNPSEWQILNTSNCHINTRPYYFTIFNEEIPTYYFLSTGNHGVTGLRSTGSKGEFTITLNILKSDENMF